MFDFILLDAPAVLDVADALAVAPKADGVLLVAHRREATRDSIVRAHEQLERVGGRVSGVVITDGKETDLISVGGPSSSSEGGASDAGRRLLDMVRRGGGE